MRSVSEWSAVAEQPSMDRSLLLRWGATDIGLDVADVRAWRTLLEIMKPRRFDAWPTAKAAFDALRTSGVAGGSGVLLLRRSQKLIAIDRDRRLVYHVLRAEHADRAELLEGEVRAAAELVGRTVPLVFAHLDAPPRFLVQRYLPYRPIGSWRDVLPHMREIVSALFRFYEAGGYETVDSQRYVAELTQRVRAAIESVSSAATRDAISHILDGVQQRLDIGSLGDALVTARVHGDFIPAHVVRPRGEGRWLLVDWSESQRRSLFYDLFYFHFQNHETDLWSRVLADPPPRHPQYWGGGYHEFCGRAASAGLAEPQLRPLLLLCLIETLEHRLTALDHVHLDMWVRQGRALLAGAPS